MYIRFPGVPLRPLGHLSISPTLPSPVKGEEKWKMSSRVERLERSAFQLSLKILNILIVRISLDAHKAQPENADTLDLPSAVFFFLPSPLAGEDSGLFYPHPALPPQWRGDKEDVINAPCFPSCNWRRERDLNPRSRLNRTTDFESAPFSLSGISP